MKYFILEGRNVVEVPYMEDAMMAFLNPGSRVIARTVVGEVTVSTVFLIFDHSMGTAGPPILFETMCFAGGESAARDHMQRYSTYDEAVSGHNTVVDLIHHQVSQSEDATTDIMLKLAALREQP